MPVFRDKLGVLSVAPSFTARYPVPVTGPVRLSVPSRCAFFAQRRPPKKNIHIFHRLASKVRRDCLGECGGSAEYDRCNVCGGDGSTCVVDFMRPDDELLADPVCLSRRGMQLQCTCSLE